MFTLLISLAYAQDVLDLINQLDSPPTAADWQAIEGADAQLIAAIGSDLNATQKGRAVQALGYVPSPAGKAELTRILSEDSTLARKAVFALAIGWGDVALPELTQAAGSEDVQLRIATIKALKKVPLGTEVLLQRKAVETDEAVLAELDKALGGAE